MVHIIGFLFDVDGCLSKPFEDIDDPRSYVDTEALDLILELIAEGHPVALVTGRSTYYMEMEFERIKRQDFLNQVSVFMEYGLVCYENRRPKVMPEGITFRNQFRPLFIDHLNQEARKQGIPFDPHEEFVDYPAHGQMWIEKKHAMLSIIANSNCSPERIKELSTTAWSKLQGGDIHHHALGPDVLPEGWSKRKAAEAFLQSMHEAGIEPEKWMVFGDSEGDKLMCLALSNAEFVDTRHGASEAVKEVLRNVLNK